MATITVKKKKPMSLRPEGDEAADAVAGETASEPVFTPSRGMAPIVAEGPSYTTSGILAIVATVLFLAVLLLQWLELSYYNAPPAAFPPPPAIASAS